MKKKIMKSTFSIFIAVIVLSGCALSNMNLANNPAFTIKRVNNNDRITISSARIYHDNGDTIVTGKVKLSKNLPQPKFGHVDIAVISLDGKVLDSASVFYNPRQRTRRMQLKASNGSTFSVRFPGLLQDGSTIRLVTHTSMEKAGDKMDKRFHCTSGLTLQ